jgi:hypothetical protein
VCLYAFRINIKKEINFIEIPFRAKIVRPTQKKRGCPHIFFIFLFYFFFIFYITYLDLPRFSAYRAFIYLWICLTGLTYEVSADWNMGILLIHSFQAYRAVAQLSHLVVEFQEHLGQVGYVGGFAITDLGYDWSYDYSCFLEVIYTLPLQEVAFPPLFRLCL